MNETKPVSSWKVSLNTINETVQKNTSAISIALGLAALIIVGWYGYRYYRIQKEQSASTILADCLNEYEQATQGKGQLADVARMCEAGYQKFSNTKTAAYLLAIEIDSLLGMQKKEEALQKLDFMITHIGSGSPLYTLYKTKQALLKLDMGTDAALADLEQLAHNSKNSNNDIAQYYLGLYYYNHDQLEKARAEWAPLALHEKVTENQARSPWVQLAQEKMNGLLA